jgi:hypothetical protein
MLPDGDRNVVRCRGGGEPLVELVVAGGVATVVCVEEVAPEPEVTVTLVVEADPQPARESTTSPAAAQIPLFMARSVPGGARGVGSTL